MDRTMDFNNLNNSNNFNPYENNFDSQIFETYGKRMRDDFTVFGVPYEEVSNPQGGETVIIAFE